MFYYLSQYILSLSAHSAWADQLSFLRLFRYITFRSAGAAITALVLSWWLGPRVIAWLKHLKFGQHYADKAEEAGGIVGESAPTPKVQGVASTPPRRCRIRAIARATPGVSP